MEECFPQDVEGRSFRLDIRMSSFTDKMVKHWNELPKLMVDFPSLQVRDVDEVLRDMVYWWTCSVTCMVGLDDLEGSFQTKWFYGSVIL